MRVKCASLDSMRTHSLLTSSKSVREQRQKKRINWHVHELTEGGESETLAKALIHLKKEERKVGKKKKI